VEIGAAYGSRNRSCRLASKLFEYLGGAGGDSLSGAVFDIERAHLAVVDDHGEALGAQAEAAAGKIGVEAGGRAIEPGQHAARFAGGAAGVLQGTRTWLLQDADGNVEPTHSVSAGLDYAAVGPEHAWLRERGRASYAHVSDAEALDAFQALARCEGILPALESSHAIAHALRVAKGFGRDAVLLVNLSGRGDKDVQSVEQALAEAANVPHR